MSDHKPSEPSPNDAAQKSEDAGIADEGAAYTNAIEEGGEAEEPEAHPS